MKLHRYLSAAVIAAFSGQAMAAGFGLNSQSATGIGRAFSGDAAIGDNASILARNPAGLALFDAKSLSLGLTYADIDIEISDPVLNPGNKQLSGIDDAGGGKVIPNIFYIQPVGEQWAFGFGAFTNFGTGSDTFSLEGAPDLLIGKTEITTINFNASGSFRINEHVSLGAGIDMIYGSGELRRDSSIASIETLLNVEASGWAFGGIIGALYEINDNHRFGISYRFSPEIAVSGDVDLLTPVGGVPQFSYDQLEVPLPDIFQFAGFHQLSDHWAVHYTAQWTGWSAFDAITGIDGETGSGVAIADRELKEYGWKDSWLFSIGGTYTINSSWTVRAGYMRDNGVIDEIDSLSIPDSTRNWYTAGLGYHLSPKSTLDFALAFVRGEEVDVSEAGSAGETVSATTLSNAVYYSMQYSYAF